MGCRQLTAEIDDVSKNQMEVLEMKNSISERKIQAMGLTADREERRDGELEDQQLKMIPTE